MGVVEAEHGIIAKAGRARADITVRELVEWTYAVQQAHRGGDGSACGYASISQTGIVGEIGALGCLIDRSPSGAQFYGVSHVDDDALIVHEHVECLHWEYRQALMQHGAVRSTPDWCPLRLPLRALAVEGRRGQPRGIYEGDGRRLIACELTYCGDVETRDDYRAMRAAWPDAPALRVYQDVVEYAREQYRMWHDGLIALQDALTWGRLRRWYVRGIGAAYEPWVNS
jgi:hypothetical protein